MPNPQQLTLSDWALIGVGLVCLVIIVGLMIKRRRMKVKEIELGVGPVKVKLEPDTQASTKLQTAQPAIAPSVRISGNKLLGSNEVDVSRDSVDVSDNTIVGKNKVDVKSDPNPKSPEKDK